MKRKIISTRQLKMMEPSTLDKLPAPAEHDGLCKRWVGIGWVTEGKATGNEPLLIK